MAAAADPGKLTTAERRRALRLGYVQIALWSIGNGLTSGAIVQYLAMELGAAGRQVGLILAAPYFVGVLRLAAPSVNHRLGVKPAAIGLLLLAYMVLLVLPALTFAETVAAWLGLDGMQRSTALWVMAGTLCLHQLLEYLGLVALWSWLGALVPLRIRGRYFSRRQILQIAVAIPTMFAGYHFVDWWEARYQDNEPDLVLLGYTFPIALGAVCLFCSLIPLAKMPVAFAAEPPRTNGWRTLLAPLSDKRFSRLLMFGCWVGFFNGLTQSPQAIYPRRVLGLSLLSMAALRTGMQLGQMSLAPWVGRFSDRYGNRPVLVLCQLVAASGMLFYFFAAPDQPWWIVGAWAAWSAYVGLNVCLPNLMLKLAPDRDNSAYIATYFGISGVCAAVGTLAGGVLLDILEFRQYQVGPWHVSHFGYMFYIGWVTRSLGVVYLLSITEPGAWTWRQILHAEPSAPLQKNEAATEAG